MLAWHRLSSKAETRPHPHPHHSCLPPSTTLSAFLLCFTLIPRCLNRRIVPDHGNVISVMGPHHHHPSVAYPSVLPRIGHRPSPQRVFAILHRLCVSICHRS